MALGSLPKDQWYCDQCTGPHPTISLQYHHRPTSRDALSFPHTHLREMEINFLWHKLILMNPVPRKSSQTLGEQRSEQRNLWA